MVAVAVAREASGENVHACQALDKVLKEHLYDVWKFSNLQI